MDNCTKNALIARVGNRAEQILCEQESVRAWLSQYFGKPVQSIAKIEGRKKSDNLVTFEDGTSCRIQNKNGNGGGRGWSVDRRELSALTNDVPFQSLLRAVCLRQGTDRPVVSNNLSSDLVRLCLLGSDPAFTPEYFTHTTLNVSGDQIIAMTICPTVTFMEGVLGELYAAVLPKRTCVHLSPSLYFQRKGGGVADSNPDHIQTKLHCSAAVSALFTSIVPTGGPEHPI